MGERNVFDGMKPEYQEKARRDVSATILRFQAEGRDELARKFGVVLDHIDEAIQRRVLAERNERARPLAAFRR